MDEYLTRVSEEELLNQPGMQPLRKDLLDLALKYYRELIDQRRDDPALQAELAAAYFRVGRIAAQSGSRKEAIEAHRRALEIRQKLVDEWPDDPNHRKALAESYREVGDL